MKRKSKKSNKNKRGKRGIGLVMILVIVAIIAVVTSIVFYFILQSKEEIEEIIEIKTETFEPLNATYVIEGDNYTLIEGKLEKEILPDSITKITIMNWDEPVMGNLNADGVNDAALILTFNPGGSGIFFYLVTAMQDAKSGKAMGGEAVLLGDRIDFQDISISKRTITVNYKDRSGDEPMSMPPSIEVTKRFTFDGGLLKEEEIE